MTFLYSIPAALLLFLALGVALVVSGGGQVLVHRRFSSQDFISHNEVGGIVIAVSGTLYAVILGFLTVVVWQHYMEAQDLVVMEANADIGVWHTVVGFPPKEQKQVRGDMLRYADIMIRNEWPDMRRGEFDPEAAMVEMDAINVVGSFVPANMGQSNAQTATLQELDVMHDARQQRIAANDSGVSWFEWLVLLIGAVCIICFCWLFGLRNSRIQLLMTSTVVTITVSILVLLFELQYPFRSDIGIGPDIWQGALNHLHQMQAGTMMNMRM